MFVGLVVSKSNGDVLSESPATAIASGDTDVGSGSASGSGRALSEEDTGSGSGQTIDEFIIEVRTSSACLHPRPRPVLCSQLNHATLLA